MESDQSNVRVGIFIGRYDAGGSHLRDFIKCLAEQNIYIDYFLCNPMGFKGIDTFSYNDEKINVYFIKKKHRHFSKSTNPIIKILRRINSYLINLFQNIEQLIKQFRYKIGPKNESWTREIKESLLIKFPILSDRLLLVWWD